MFDPFRIELARAALIVIDMQQGFTTLCPAELPVPGGLEIVPPINELMSLTWRRIDATVDWHPNDHCSFQGQRDNLYPPHCVAGTPGADFVPGLRTERFQTIWRKGFEQEKEAYAVTVQHPAFVAALRAEGIRTTVICGIAINICCFFTARDLRKAGFEVVIVEDASAGIDIPTSGLFQKQTKIEGEHLGIRYLTVADVMTSTQSIYLSP